MDKKSSFQFNGFKVIKSLIEIKGQGSEELKLEIEPKATLNNQVNVFTLEMKVVIVDETGNIKIEIIVEGEYSIAQRDENLKPFLFTNAPAILFPYVRSYITSLTALSGTSPIILPTMNLSSLKERLTTNFSEIN